MGKILLKFFSEDAPANDGNAPDDFEDHPIMARYMR
jgi:hypothetical protein